MLGPIPLEESSHAHAPFTVGLRRIGDGYWQFWESVGDGEFSFDFRDVLADEQAMSVRCDSLQTSPESRFVQNLVCQVRRPDAQVVLRGRVLSTIARDGKQERTLDSAEELVAVLESEFGLLAPEAATLWARICARHEQLMA